MTRMIDVDLLIAAFEKVYPLATNEMGGVVNKRIYDIINSIPIVPESCPNCTATTALGSQGDLISRAALQAELDDYIDDSLLEISDVKELIDNAPAVKFSLLPADGSKEESYMRGYEHGLAVGLLKTRPTGEWIKSNYTDEITCSVCREVMKPIIFNNFCPNCGAYMRKGGAE